MRKFAKKMKVSSGVLGAIGAAVIGLAAGAAAVFLSKEGNRKKVKNTVDSTVKKGKVELAKANKKIVSVKRKIVKR